MRGGGGGGGVKDDLPQEALTGYLDFVLQQGGAFAFKALCLVLWRLKGK